MKLRQAFHCILVSCLLTAFAVGCANMPVPKAVKKDGITSELKKRKEEANKLFSERRDFAEYEEAKNRWEQQRDVKGSREILEKLLARNPKHIDAHLLSSELSLIEDDPQGAYQHAKAALEIAPNEGRVQHAMGMAMDGLGHTSEALSYYDRAAKMSPENEAYQAAYQSAREAAQEKLGRRKSISKEIFEEAAVEEAMEMPLDDAYEASSIAPAPEKPVKLANYEEKSDSGDLKGDRQDAEVQKVLSEAVQSLRANQPDQAVKLLTPATKQFPKSVSLHRTLGVAFYRLGDYESSQVALQQALSLDNSDALSYLLMGCTLAKLGKTEAAASHFKQARTLDPRYGVAR